ncbi:MAG: Gldg family protein, partial [Promethearchaeia archaeon]
MPGKIKVTVGLDYSHDNKLVLEASSYSEFTQFLFTSGYKLGKIQAGFDSLQKLKNYDLIVLSTPRHEKLSEEEIENLIKYVEEGGNILVINSTGGDKKNRTNLNDLTENFGFKFNPDTIYDSMSYINLQKRPLFTKLTPHVITEQVQKVVLSSACSLEILEFIEDDKDIKIEEVIEGGLNCWRKRYDEEKKDWIREDSPKVPMLVAVDYFKGHVIGFGTLSIFSSLGREYGFTAFDNDVLIANIFRWLTSGGITEGKTLTLVLNLQLFYWAKSIVEDENWDSLSDLINVSLKYFKDNYKNILEEIKELREKKKKRKKEYKKAKKEEDQILELVPKRDK